MEIFKDEYNKGDMTYLLFFKATKLVTTSAERAYMGP